MPRKIRKPIGTIYRETTELTAWDKIKEFLEKVAAFAFVIGLLYLFLS